VADGCVVKLPSGVEYVVLSYVWGKDRRLKLQTHNLPVLLSKGYLRSGAGRSSDSILDAIHVVECLGNRYLEVGALCII
jgi:hypothetical protein